MTKTRPSLEQVLLSVFVVACIPAFLYKRFGKRVTGWVMFLNGFVMAVAAVFTQPLILIVNPILALIAVFIPEREKHQR
jgi:uncharacterized membrane-anchored protein YitT (DUF2179 family)